MRGGGGGAGRRGHGQGRGLLVRLADTELCCQLGCNSLLVALGKGPSSNPSVRICAWQLLLLAEVIASISFAVGGLRVNEIFVFPRCHVAAQCACHIWIGGRLYTVLPHDFCRFLSKNGQIGNLICCRCIPPSDSSSERLLLTQQYFPPQARGTCIH